MAGLRAGECPYCFSAERTRLMWLYLEREHPPTGRILHVAPERGIRRRLERMVEYTPVDLAGLNGAIRADLCDLPFEDRSFDLVICSHVLEHIPDDRKAMSEMRRVLKPGGAALMQHPIGRDTTYENPAVLTPQKRLEHFGQSDHVRIYGRDLLDRLRQAGFHVTEIDYRQQLGPDEIERYRLENAEPIHFCR
jgi:SAM-dependent methyltransferase